MALFLNVRICGPKRSCFVFSPAYKMLIDEGKVMSGLVAPLGRREARKGLTMKGRGAASASHSAQLSSAGDVSLMEFYAGDAPHA